MLETTANFIETLKKNDWKYKDLQELDNGMNRVTCGVNCKLTDRKLQIMEMMNDTNKSYRWTKFFIDDESWMNIQIDAVVNAETAGPVGLELMMRTCQIIDTVYSKFMHEIWA